MLGITTKTPAAAPLKNAAPASRPQTVEPRKPAETTASPDTFTRSGAAQPSQKAPVKQAPARVHLGMGDRSFWNSPQTYRNMANPAWWANPHTYMGHGR